MRPLAAIWMNLQIVMLNEVSQTEKHKISCDIAYMWNIKEKDTLISSLIVL